jgi:hypothetical protein
MTSFARRLPLPLSAWAGLSFALLLASVGIVRAPDTARGAALMALAQQAIGGSKGLAGVKTLQVTGTFRRVIGGSDTDGDFDVFIELPDKYLRSEKTGTPGQPSTETIEALVGTEIRDAVRGGRVGAAARRGGPNDDSPPVDLSDAAGAGQREAGRDGGGSEVPPVETDVDPAPAAGRGRGGAPVDPDAQRRARQADVSRLLLMWLLRSDAPLGWVGTAQSPDGTADVIEVRYADGLPTRLFLESTTHMPLMLQWTAAPARGGGPDGRRGAGGRRGAAPEGAAAREGGPPQSTTLDMTFSDHRAVNGIRLPYVITRGSNGQTTERWTISRYRVNPSLDAEVFTR